MNRLVSAMLWLLATLVLLPLDACAEGVNPNFSMSIVGSDTYHAVPGTILPERFTVRIVDRLGAPVPDIVVWFYADCPVGVPESPLPGCPRGSFVGVDPDKLVTGVTNPDGVAMAPPYRVAGSIDIVAGVYSFDNGGAIGSPPLVKFFHINHTAEAIPDPPLVDTPGDELPNAASILAVPALSPWALLGLIGMIVAFVAARHRP